MYGYLTGGFGRGTGCGWSDSASFLGWPVCLRSVNGLTQVRSEGSEAAKSLLPGSGQQGGSVGCGAKRVAVQCGCDWVVSGSLWGLVIGSPCCHTPSTDG